MSTDDKPKPRRRLLGWILPRRGRWHWAVLRLAIVVSLIIVFRLEIVTWLVAGHNLAWRTLTGARGNHPGDTRLLTRLAEPGIWMLLRIGEDGALTRIRDPEMIPVLLGIARMHPDPRTRAYAFVALRQFKDERTIELASAALSDPDKRVRLAAAHLFDELGQQKHLPLLRRAAKAESAPVVRVALERAIKVIALGPATPKAERTVKVAAVQFISQYGQPEHNRKRLEGYIREAAGNGAKIVVLPEVAIPGYLSFDLGTAWQAEGFELSEGLRGVPLKDVAETVPGPSTRAFAALAKQLGIYLTVPIIEIDPKSSKYYNTLCLVGPQGRLLIHYRKRHPWPHAERGWTSRGGLGLPHIDTPYGRLALLICYDVNYELPRLKQKKVDTVLYSIAWVDDDKSPWFDIMLPRKARDNNINIIGANWTVPHEPDWHGYGDTCIIDRTGRILARASRKLGEEIIYAELPIPAKQ